MALLMLIYTICASRTNVVYFIIFATLIVVFSLLAAAYWHIGLGYEASANRLVVVSSGWIGIYKRPNGISANQATYTVGKRCNSICNIYAWFLSVDSAAS